MKIKSPWKDMLFFGLEQLYPKWSNNEVHYCCGENVSQREMALACRLIQETPVLPWPTESCVIASEGWPFRGQLVIIARHGKTNRVRAQLLSMQGKRPVIVRQFDGLFRHYDTPVTGHAACSQTERLATALARSMPESDSKTAIQMGVANLLLTLLGRVLDGPKREMDDDMLSSFWAEVPLPAKTKGVNHLLSGLPLVFALANIATPTGYRIVATRKHGNNGRSHKRPFVASKLIIFAPFSRMYSESPGKAKRKVEPHKRKGHYRYLWKAAGVNRHTLPDEVYLRMQIALRENVQRVYVKPHYVGLRCWEDDEYEYEVD